MSMLSHQIEQLKDLRFRMGTTNKPNSIDWKIVESAIDTIEALSAKLSAANMERSEAYYGGGWIACKDRLPENIEDDSTQYLITVKVGEDEYEIDFGWWSKISKYDNCQKKWIDFFGWTVGNDWDEGQGMEVIAWQSLPSPYKPDKE